MHKDQHSGLEELGIMNKQVLKKILNSPLPLVKLFMFLSYKDSDWMKYLKRMNDAIDENNTKGRKKSKKYRIITNFTPEEFIICHALMIGSACHTERGSNL